MPLIVVVKVLYKGALTLQERSVSELPLRFMRMMRSV